MPSYPRGAHRVSGGRDYRRVIATQQNNATGTGSGSSGTAPALTYAATVLADSPKGYWKFKDGSGTSLADSSGNGLTLTTHASPTLSNAGPGTGETCLTLSGGSSQYADGAHNAALNMADIWTIEFWIKGMGSSGSDQFIFTKGPNAYAAKYSTANCFQLQRPGVADLDRTAAFTGSIWYHVVLAKTGSTQTSYVNGTSSHVAVANSTCTDNSNSFFVGVHASLLAGTYISGSLAHLAVYNTVLSPARVSAHYAAMV